MLNYPLFSPEQNMQSVDVFSAFWKDVSEKSSSKERL